MRLAYLAVSFAMEACSSLWNLYALFFLTDVAQLPNVQVAVIAGSYRFWYVQFATCRITARH